MSERASSANLIFIHLLSLLFMAVLTFIPESEKPVQKPARNRNKHHSKPKEKPKQQQQPSSWDQIKNMFTCKQIEDSKIHDPKSKNSNGYSKLGSCSSICSFRDVVNGNTRVVHRADNSPDSCSVGQETGLLMNKKVRNHVNGSAVSVTTTATARSSMRSGGGGGGHHGNNKGGGGGSRGMQLRKLSGCYECHAVLDASTRFPTARSSISVCSECGEVFPKIESLEHHQAVRHAVSELAPEDSGRNIVEIIFKSSWLKKDNPIYNIERILKVHNTRRTIQRFEDCRDAVKIRANANLKKNPRCAADGNELLRFHCTTLTCSLGARGSSSLCGSIPSCGVCTIIRHGFQGQKAAAGGGAGSGGEGGKGVRTTASSGRAHDCLGVSQTRRAMLVCRVIAGKVRRMGSDGVEDDVASPGPYDSVAGYAGVYSNLEELYVFNPRAILPCFVVIYKAIES